MKSKNKVKCGNCVFSTDTAEYSTELPKFYVICQRDETIPMIYRLRGIDTTCDYGVKFFELKKNEKKGKNE
jgi:hypothetical protein